MLQPMSKDTAAASGSDSSEVEEEDANVVRFYRKQCASNNADELVVTAAKQMGKELYANLSAEERKEKLDNMVRVLTEYSRLNTRFIQGILYCNLAA